MFEHFLFVIPPRSGETGPGFGIQTKWELDEAENDSNTKRKTYSGCYIELTDFSRVWTGHLEREDWTKRYKADQGFSKETFEGMVVHGLSGETYYDDEWTLGTSFDERAGQYQLKWWTAKVNPSMNVLPKNILGSLKLTPNSNKRVNEVWSHWIQNAKAAQKKAKDVSKAHKIIISELQESVKNLTVDKELMKKNQQQASNDSLEVFMRVLNTKKDKIKKLMDTVARLESDLDLERSIHKAKTEAVSPDALAVDPQTSISAAVSSSTSAGSPPSSAACSQIPVPKTRRKVTVKSESHTAGIAIKKQPSPGTADMEVDMEEARDLLNKGNPIRNTNEEPMEVDDDEVEKDDLASKRRKLQPYARADIDRSSPKDTSTGTNTPTAASKVIPDPESTKISPNAAGMAMRGTPSLASSTTAAISKVSLRVVKAEPGMATITSAPSSTSVSAFTSSRMSTTLKSISKPMIAPMRRKVVEHKEQTTHTKSPQSPSSRVLPTSSRARPIGSNDNHSPKSTTASRTKLQRNPSTSSHGRGADGSSDSVQDTSLMLANMD